MEPYQKLEQEWAAWNELDPAGMVACSSGTAALHLALEAFRLPPGSEVLVPDYTMVAVPRAVTLAGLKPRFVDCTPDTLLMDDGDSFGYATSETYSAMIAVHVYGRKPDMDWISSTAGVNHPVIEDLAEAHGTRPHEITDAACWSFYRNKIVAGEEGGAVWFRDPEHAALARQLRSLGFTDAHDYTHIPRGHNYRLANCLADRVRASLRMADTHLKVLGIVEGWYDSFCPAPWRMPRRDAVWVYDFRVPGMSGEQQKRVVDALQLDGIKARYGFKPMTMQEEYRPLKQVGYTLEPKTNAQRAITEVVYLPVEPFVTREEDCGRAFQVVKSALFGASWQ